MAPSAAAVVLSFVFCLDGAGLGAGSVAAEANVQTPNGGRGNPSCWTMGFTWEQCCHATHGKLGNPTCWDAHTHNADTCCWGDLFEPRGCPQIVANFDFGVIKLIPAAWESCVQAMENDTERCNSARTTRERCPECAALSEHATKYIQCVREEQGRVLRADGGGAGDEDAPRPSVSGWHYPVVFVPRKSGRDFAVAAPAFDAYVGNRLIVDGGWMHHEVQLLVRLMQPGEVLVDAGANIGGFTLPLAKHLGPEGRVYAFEPFRLLFQCLSANVMLNGLSNVNTYQAGLGNVSETLMQRQPNLNAISNPSKMYVAAEVASELMVRRDPRPDSAEPLQVMRLDEIDFGRRGPSMIKVDVESMELPMMQGAVETLRRYRPLLYVEDSDTPFGSSKTTRLSRFLEAQGYHLVDLDDCGFHEATSSLFVPLERTQETERHLRSLKWGDR